MQSKLSASIKPTRQANTSTRLKPTARPSMASAGPPSRPSSISAGCTNCIDNGAGDVVANVASTSEANESQPPPEVPSAVVAASPQLTQQERAKAEALADRALQGDLKALKTFEAEVPNARTYLIEVFGNLARDTRRQNTKSCFSPEDAIRKRSRNTWTTRLSFKIGI
jgi:hypothetical protein